MRGKSPRSKQDTQNLPLVDVGGIKNASTRTNDNDRTTATAHPVVNITIYESNPKTFPINKMAVIVTLLAMAMEIPSILTPLWTASAMCPLCSPRNLVVLPRMWGTRLRHCIRNCKEREERANPLQSQVWQQWRCESATLWILLVKCKSHFFQRHIWILRLIGTQPTLPLLVPTWLQVILYCNFALTLLIW